MDNQAVNSFSLVERKSRTETTMKPIYEPKTRAKEYCDLAINIYQGCSHGCTYCYARKMFERYHPNEKFDVKLRPGIIEATKKQLSSGKFEGNREEAEKAIEGETERGKEDE